MAELYNKIGLGLMVWSPVSFGLAQGDKHEESHGLVTKLLLKVRLKWLFKKKPFTQDKNCFQSLKYQSCNQQPKNAMDATAVYMEPGTTNLAQSQAVTQVSGLLSPFSKKKIAADIVDEFVLQGTALNGTTDHNADKVKRLSAIADSLGCNLVQLQLAWQLRNQTIQCTTISATSTDQLMDLLNSLNVSTYFCVFPLYWS